MTSIAFDIGRVVLSWLFLAYTIVAVSHFVVQMVYAHRTFRRQASDDFAREFPDLPVSVDVVVPVFNEDPVLLERCVRSAFAQDHPGDVRVFVVDDGSSNRARLDPVYDELERAGAVVIRSSRNAGKRHAQGLAFPRGTGEIIVTVDSDTILAPDAIRRLTRQFRDPRIGATTGFVDVENYRRNLLTRLQRLRYWMAFNQERAAQSWFRTLLCCSGPLAAYRRSIVERVQGAYLSQMYGGVPCTFGDDRHLTNLVLAEGYDTVFDGGALAFTHVPERLPQFVRQQLRWSKSFYRELIWTLPFIGGRPWYARYDITCQVAMPMMLTITAGTALAVGLLADPSTLLRYGAFVVAAALVRSTYGAIRQRDPQFYLFALYGFASAFMMMSVRLIALYTLTDARWGTRGPAQPPLGPSGLQFAYSLGPVTDTSRDYSLMAAPDPSPELPASAASVAIDGRWRAGLLIEGSAAGASPTTPATPSHDVTESPVAPNPCCAYVGLPDARFCRACGAPRQTSANTAA